MVYSGVLALSSVDHGLISCLPRQVSTFMRPCLDSHGSGDERLSCFISPPRYLSLERFNQRIQSPLAPGLELCLLVALTCNNRLWGGSRRQANLLMLLPAAFLCHSDLKMTIVVSGSSKWLLYIGNTYPSMGIGSPIPTTAYLHLDSNS